MTTRSWQIYGVGFILMVLIALVALWVSPADAKLKAKPQEPKEIQKPERPKLIPQPKRPDPTVGRPSLGVGDREPVRPVTPRVDVTPRPTPSTPTHLSPVVTPSVPPVAPVRPIRSDDRDRNRPSPPPVREPYKYRHVEPAPAPAPLDDLVFDVGWDLDPDAAACEEAMVCPLDRWDDYLAWRLVRTTGIPYWQLAYERLDGWSWYAILDRLEIERDEFCAALNVNWSRRGPFSDEDVRMAVAKQIGHHVLPEFSCQVPIELPVFRSIPYLADGVNEDIAELISEDTLWCVDTLLSLHGHLRDWGAVARVLYLSPYMFDAIFGVELVVHPSGVVEYPHESDVRFAVIEFTEDEGGDPLSALVGGVASGVGFVVSGVASLFGSIF